MQKKNKKKGGIPEAVINQLAPDGYINKKSVWRSIEKMIEIEKYKNHDIVKNGDEYRIIWDRGKKYFGYNVTESLAEKSRKSDKDALEIMFYLENKRWPKEYELENYNKTNIKKHVGNQFIIYEEDGKYEISFEKESGGVSLGDVCYPITKKLMEKAFKSDRDVYEVKIYAETGSWPTANQDETV